MEKISEIRGPITEGDWDHGPFAGVFSPVSEVIRLTSEKEVGR